MTREHCPWYWLFINGVWRAGLWVLLHCIYICDFANWAAFCVPFKLSDRQVEIDCLKTRPMLVKAADLMHMNSLLILFWLKSNLGLKNSFCQSIEISLPVHLYGRENAFFHATSQPTWAKHILKLNQNQIEQLPVCGVLYLIVYRQQSTLSSYIQLYKPSCTRLPKAVDARNNSLLSHAGYEFGCVTSSVHVVCDVIRDDAVQTCVQNLTLWQWCHIQMFRFM